MLLEQGFAAVVLGLLSFYACAHLTEYALTLADFRLFNSMSWYVGYYFIILVIAKVFGNALLRRLDQRQYVMLMIALFSIVQFRWSRAVLDSIADGLDIICLGVFLYSLGGYIRLYDPFRALRSWSVMALIVVMNLILIRNFYLVTAGSIAAYDPGSGSAFIQNIPRYGNYEIVPVVLGISLFELFRRLQVPSNAVINFMGSSTLMVYLFHDTKFIYRIWNIRNWVALLQEGVLPFAATYGLWAVGTFLAGLLVYCLFLLAGKALCVCKPLLVRSGDTQGPSGGV